VFLVADIERYIALHSFWTNFVILIYLCATTKCRKVRIECGISSVRTSVLSCVMVKLCENYLNCPAHCVKTGVNVGSLEGKNYADLPYR